MEKQSAPGIYSGYSQPRYNGYVMSRIYIPLKDGTRLGATILRPAKDGVPEPAPLPTIVHLTPYPFITMQDGKQTFHDNLQAMELIPYGYVLAEVELRGTGISFGTRQVVNSRQEARDGAEVVEWIAAQEYCNAVVGTIGWSYHGQTQLGAISQKPPHLKAALIGMTDFNRYDGWVRNAVPRAFGSQPDMIWSQDSQQRERQIEQTAEKEIPVDEDPDGILLREAIREHISNGLQVPMQRNLIWRDSVDMSLGGEVWRQLSASTYRQELEDSGVQIYLLGGLYDVFRRDTVMMYHNLNNARKLTFGPWYHVGIKRNPYPWVEALRWFDYWLKGIDNGIMDERPIQLCIGQYDFVNQTHDGEKQNGWMEADAWPIHKGTRKTYYFSTRTNQGALPVENGSLTECAMPREEVTCRAVYGITTSVESRFTEEENGRGADQLGMTFVTPPFTQDCTFIGHPMAHLVFELLDPGCLGERADLDFFVTVSDYDPETDKSFQFDDGHLRSSQRGTSQTCPYDFLGLPWHEARKEDTRYLRRGERYTLDIDLMPVCYTVKAGHRLRVSIENSQSRMYYAGMAQYEENPACIPPQYKLIFGGEEGCRIILPNIFSE